jgi:serine/threonine-protein kinase RsbW
MCRVAAMTLSRPEVQITIHSRFEELDLLDSLSEALLRHLGFRDEAVERAALAVREAAANAIQHGNGADSEEPVVVRFQVDNRDLVIEVADLGQGFDPEALPDPLAPENLLKKSGRGILLMKSLLDDVAFRFEDRGGTVVTMRKRLAPAAEASNTESPTGDTPTTDDNTTTEETS